MPATGLARRIKKRNPFKSAHEEAYLNLLLTNEVLAEPFSRLFKNHGLSESTYNVLRICRGEHPKGVPVLEIRRRMVSRVPDVTRLVDRLEEAGLLCRHRCENDRRVVFCHITEKGLDLLGRLDEPVGGLERNLLSHLTDTELRVLSDLLEKARAPWDAELADTPDESAPTSSSVPPSVPLSDPTAQP